MADAAPERIPLDIAEILHRTAKSVHAVLDLPIERIRVGPTEFDPVGEAHIDMTVTFAGTAVLASGAVEVVVRTTCVRCLAELEVPIRGEIEGFYVAHGTEDDLPEEQEYEFIEGTSIDVLPAIRSAIVLELPFAPVHAAGCEIPCPACGEQPTTCTCGAEPPASPFSVLKSLLEDGDE